MLKIIGFTGVLLTAALVGGVTPGLVNGAQAHHSFAVHFVADRTIDVHGVVKEFRFSNPHGVIFLTVTDADGTEVTWKVETNSPNMLRRRGWSKKSLKPGQEITVNGFPARDGSPLMRVAAITFADGSELVGQRSAAGQD